MAVAADGTGLGAGSAVVDRRVPFFLLPHQSSPLRIAERPRHLEVFLPAAVVVLVEEEVVGDPDRIAELEQQLPERSR